jgi:hypothetical protein
MSRRFGLLRYFARCPTDRERSSGRRPAYAGGREHRAENRGLARSGELGRGWDRMRGMFFGVGRMRSASWWLTSRGALALLLVLALFVCHGAFGVTLHEELTRSVGAGEVRVGTPLSAAGESPLRGPTSAGATAADEDALRHLAAVLFLHLVSHVGDDEATDAALSFLGHVGALLFVLSAVAFLPWLRNVPRRRRTLLAGPLFWRFYPAREVGLASRSTIPALQVFRL